jgi:hypothetical protein
VFGILFRLNAEKDQDRVVCHSPEPDQDMNLS